MNTINIADNISRLRRKKNITQEELAEFIGVTKASVSKWENGQSMPDIMLLPMLASFFDITVDELIGYEPQLSKAQIQKLYIQFAAEFAEQPFEEVREKLKSYIKRYYSCYQFLQQMCVLLINHYPKAVNPQEALAEGIELCNHILDNCTDTKIINNTIIIKAVYELQTGNADAVIDTLENICDPVGLNYQGDGILVQAYVLKGDIDKAESCNQLNMYLHILSLVASSIQYLTYNMANVEGCRETMRRTEGLIKLYKLDNLHPNSTAQYYYQAAVIHTMYGELEEAVEMLGRYVDCACAMLKDTFYYLHGDEYFSRLDEWIENLELGGSPVRDRNSVVPEVMASLELEVFAPIKNNPEYKLLQIKLKEELQ